MPRVIGGLKTTVIRKVACGDMFTACLTGVYVCMYMYVCMYVCMYVYVVENSL